MTTMTSDRSFKRNGRVLIAHRVFFFNFFGPTPGARGKDDRVKSP